MPRGGESYCLTARNNLEKGETGSWQTQLSYGNLTKNVRPLTRVISVSGFFYLKI
jgi:hypothetical protein